MVARQGRAAEIETALARLAAQYELAMSSFKFDDARALQREIEAFEIELQKLGANSPVTAPVDDPAPVGIIPVLERPRRGRFRR